MATNSARIIAFNSRTKVAATPKASSRPFENSYSAGWQGYCKTRESAVIAAMRHTMDGYYTSCTITNRETGEHVATVKLNSDLRVTITFAKELPKGTS